VGLVHRRKARPIGRIEHARILLQPWQDLVLRERRIPQELDSQPFAFVVVKAELEQQPWFDQVGNDLSVDIFPIPNLEDRDFVPMIVD
jgi:hypothetical protein